VNIFQNNHLQGFFLKKLCCFPPPPKQAKLVEFARAKQNFPKFVPIVLSKNDKKVWKKNDE
jgi:hypothetical protein